MSTTSALDFQAYTILIIDDTPANLGVVVEHLEDYSFRVVIAQSGKEGLKRAEFAQPDLILLDVMMPGIDGFETCRRLKANEKTKDIPVIFMTSLAETENKVTGFEVGGVDYVTKPIQFREVLARIKTHLTLRNMQKQIEAQNAQLEQEIVERKRAEESLQQAHDELEQRVEKRTVELAQANASLRTEITEHERTETLLRKTNRAYKALSDCNQVLIRATEETELLHEVCRIIKEDCEYHLVWIGFAEQDEAKTVCPVAQAGYAQGYLDTVNITWADTQQGRGPTGTAIRTREPVINIDILTNPVFAPWRAQAIKHGYASSAALPLLTSQGEAIGALNVYATQPDAFAPAEVELLGELAGDLAYGVTSLRVQAERRQAEKSLRESEERFRQVITSISDHIYMTEVTEGEEHINHYISPNVEVLTGYPLEKFAGDWHFWASSVIHPDDRARAAEQVAHLVCGQDSETEYRLVRADRQVIWVRDSARVECTSAASRLIYGVVSDITERKQAEEALRESEERYRSLFEDVPVGLYRSTPEGQILDVNMAQVEMLGYPDRGSFMETNAANSYVSLVIFLLEFKSQITLFII